MLKAQTDYLGIGGDNNKVLLLSDGNRKFTKAIEVYLDLSDKAVGLGVWLRRYSLLADNGVVKILNLEEGGSFIDSGVDDILKAIWAFIGFEIYGLSFNGFFLQVCNSFL